MQKLTTLLLSLLLAGSCKAQPNHYSYEEWQIEAITNKRLLPRYGHLSKPEHELEADAAFIASIKRQKDFTTMRGESMHMVRIGFNYLYKGDLRTAMYRFNQSYLLDSTSTDDYWGYGAVYIQLGNYELAEAQYRTGLQLDSLNHHLWTDLGTLFVIKFEENGKEEWLDTAIQYLNRSYQLQDDDVNTCYKLSTAYFRKGQCAEAKRFYNECVALGGNPVTEEYKNALETKCE